MGNADLSPGVDIGSHASLLTNNKMSGKVLLAAVTFLFLTAIFTILLIVYVKENWFPRIATNGRNHLIITANDIPVPKLGLRAVVLRSLPVNVFQRSDFKDGIECSVCLCELSDGEKFRLLPKCSHGFHLDCIDMWLHSHFTCPICRCPVDPVAATSGEVSPATEDGQPSSESFDLPTNLMFWRNNGRFNTRGLSAYSGRSILVTVPNRFADELPSPMPPLGSNTFWENLNSPVEDARSPGTSQFESLRRILSRGKRSSGSSCSSPVDGDIEQGLARSVVKEQGSSIVPKPPIST